MGWENGNLQKGGVLLKKKEYDSPELTLIKLILQEDLCGASGPENFSSYIDDGNNDWGDLDPGDGDIDFG